MPRPPRPTRPPGSAPPAAGRRRRRLPRSLAGQLFSVQIVIVAAVVAGCAVLAYLGAGERAEQSARRQVTAAARAVADSPSVRAAIVGPDPTAVLQPYAEQVRADSGVDFVTVLDTHGIRLAHRDPAQIGKPYLGHIGQALAGRPSPRPTPARSAPRCG